MGATARGLEESLARKTDQQEFATATLELQRGVDALRNDQDERIESSLGALRGQIADLQAASRAQRLSILEEERKYDVLLAETRKRLPKKLDASQLEGVLSDESHARDTIYAQFEDRFRGTREEIKERLKQYLPYAAAAVEATRGAPLLDLGCGRGEWLETIGGAGWKALGIDSNRIMVDRCVEQDFEVEEGEALEFLRSQKKNSFSVVTGFHVIEHIPFSEVVSLLDESLRVLRPGGIVIFETPNPENLMVGACNFYADPTHQNPIFPPTLEFVLKERGFEGVELLRTPQGQDPDAFEPLAPSDPLAARLNPILAVLKAGFSASPDFAAMGRKA
jgi:2-polyprenyl-3-methyl-5-hydroxy-6-metoxy-1,4-benzoquinol methylase